MDCRHIYTWAKFRKVTKNRNLTCEHDVEMQFTVFLSNAFVCKRQQKHSSIYAWHKTLRSSSRPIHIAIVLGVCGLERTSDHIFLVT